MRSHARWTHVVSINAQVNSSAPICQSKQYQIPQLFGWEVSRLSCIAGKYFTINFHNTSDSAQIMAGLTSCLD